MIGKVWAKFQIERTRIARRDLVEFLRIIGDDAGEDIKPPGRALGLVEADKMLRQIDRSQQRHDIDAAGFEHCALAEIDDMQAEPAQFVATRLLGPGRKEARTRKALAPRRRSRLAGWIWS